MRCCALMNEIRAPYFLTHWFYCERWIHEVSEPLRQTHPNKTTEAWCTMLDHFMFYMDQRAKWPASRLADVCVPYSVWLRSSPGGLLYEEWGVSVHAGLPADARHALQRLRGLCGGGSCHCSWQDLPPRLLRLHHLQVRNARFRLADEAQAITQTPQTPRYYRKNFLSWFKMFIAQEWNSRTNMSDIGERNIPCCL